MSKLVLGENVPARDVTVVSTNTFKVCSQTAEGTVYTVHLDAPSCSCPSFLMSHMLCKHIFACLHHSQHHSWRTLPQSYTQDPRFTLDPEVTQSRVMPCRSQDDITVHVQAFPVPSSTTAPITVARPKVPLPKKSVITEIHDELQDISSTVYRCTDEEDIAEATETLKCIKTKLNLSVIKTAEGLPVTPHSRTG